MKSDSVVMGPPPRPQMEDIILKCVCEERGRERERECMYVLWQKEKLLLYLSYCLNEAMLSWFKNSKQINAVTMKCSKLKKKKHLPCSNSCRDKKLRPICVGTCICHRQKTWQIKIAVAVFLILLFNQLSTYLPCLFFTTWDAS